MENSRKWRPAFVTVTATASTAMALTGCAKPAATPPDATPSATPTVDVSAPTPTAARSAASAAPGSTVPGPKANNLPTWNEVASGHPPGATNPPSPILQLVTNGDCYKQWHAGMLPAPNDTKQHELGGTRYAVRVVTGPDAFNGMPTRIACPPGSKKLVDDEKGRAVAPKTPVPSDR